jgi:hypothetical protein
MFFTVGEDYLVRIRRKMYKHFNKRRQKINYQQVKNKNEK